MKDIRVGICGLGTVGSGVLDLFISNRDRINAQVGVPINVIKVGSRTRKTNQNHRKISFSEDVLLLADDPDIDIVLELIGGTNTALDLVRKALKNGKHVVTANKRL